MHKKLYCSVAGVTKRGYTAATKCVCNPRVTCGVHANFDRRLNNRTHLPFATVVIPRLFESAARLIMESVHEISVPSSAPVHNFILKDAVHGNIALHAASKVIVNTPQFQRLRNLKQLGATYLVYTTAAHNRFEHCVGTAYLARKFLAHLKEVQPELFGDEVSRVTPTDELCVELAGLIHDLGHGVLSHSFEVFINSQRRKNGQPEWHHEMATIHLFRHMLDSNPGVKAYLHACGLTDGHLHLIQQLVFGSKAKFESIPIHVVDMAAAQPSSASISSGPSPSGPSKPVMMQWFEPPPHKRFLFDIVANDRCGIDVDKWDYFQRDSQGLGPGLSFDADRLMWSARVMWVADKAGRTTTIAYALKESKNVYNMFAERARLHERAYQHKVVKGIEAM